MRLQPRAKAPPAGLTGDTMNAVTSVKSLPPTILLCLLTECDDSNPLLSCRPPSHAKTQMASPLNNYRADSPSSARD